MCKNDCAITQSEHDGELYLLETIPGLRFRAREYNQDYVAAIKAFRSMVEEDFRSNVEASEDNPATNYPWLQSIHRHSLTVIPSDLISVKSWTTPLGRGQNGVVFEGIWDRPQQYLSTSEGGPIEVVLKDVLEAGTTTGDVSQSFVREVSGDQV